MERHRAQTGGHESRAISKTIAILLVAAILFALFTVETEGITPAAPILKTVIALTTLLAAGNYIFSGSGRN